MLGKAPMPLYFFMFMRSGNRKTEYIRHNAVIVKLDGNMARVQIVRPSACESCDASRGCGIRKGKKMLVDIVDERLQGYKPGDVVCVEMSSSMGRQAVALGFGLPLVVFVAVLSAMHLCGCADGLAALAAIAALVVYYLVIYILRGMLERRFAIRLAK